LGEKSTPLRTRTVGFCFGLLHDRGARQPFVVCPGREAARQTYTKTQPRSLAKSHRGLLCVIDTTAIYGRSSNDCAAYQRSVAQVRLLYVMGLKRIIRLRCGLWSASSSPACGCAPNKTGALTPLRATEMVEGRLAAVNKVAPAVTCLVRL